MTGDKDIGAMFLAFYSIIYAYGGCYALLEISTYARTHAHTHTHTNCYPKSCIMSLYWLSGKTSLRQVSRNFEAAMLDVKMIVSLCNLTDISATALPSYWKSLNPNLRLPDFTRSCDKTSVRLVNRGLAVCPLHIIEIISLFNNNSVTFYQSIPATLV